MKHYPLQFSRMCLFIVLISLFSMNVFASEEGHGEDVEHETHWGYGEGAGAPEHWDKYEKGGVCNIGHAQSPVEITKAIAAPLVDIQFEYQDLTSFSLKNNGHTIQANVNHGNTITYHGVSYKLRQFHFHHPSEHIVDGVDALMEAHFVHEDPQTGKLAVIGVLLTLGDEPNPAYGYVFDQISDLGNQQLSYAYNLNDFFPDNLAYVTYEGSLTTPPCSEIVRWLVLTEPVALSQAQIDIFSTLYPMNARATQELHGRTLLGSSN
jgi:carbonic anhydrase